MEYAKDLWRRAEKALKSAETLLVISGDDAASRAYYAVFNAVSALFALHGKTFVKHSAVRAAVHRELVKEGLWSTELGADFDSVWELRELGDYGGDEHVTTTDAHAAVETAKRVLATILSAQPELAEK